MRPKALTDLVELNDIAATFRAIAGAEMPTSQARSLLPAFKGGSVAHEVAISEAYGMAMFRTGRYKLVVHEDDQQPIQFFDLRMDPLEDRNLIGRPDAREPLDRMMARYARPFLSTPPLRRTGPWLKLDRWRETGFSFPMAFLASATSPNNACKCPLRFCKSAELGELRRLDPAIAAST